MKDNTIHIFTLIDTKLKLNDASFYNHITRQTLGPLAQFRSTPAQHSKGEHTHGGIACIISEDISPQVTSFTTDPTSLGIISTLHLQLGPQKVQIIPTYWPNSHLHSTSTTNLWSKLQSYIHKQNYHTSPLSYLQNQILKLTKIDQFTTTIVLGDLNTTLLPESKGRFKGGIHGNLTTTPFHTWSTFPAELDIITRSVNTQHTWIDHILLSPLTSAFICNVTTSADSWWEGITDHRPLSSTICFPHASLDSTIYQQIRQSRKALKKLKVPPHCNIDLTNKPQRQLYTDTMSTITHPTPYTLPDAESFLQDISHTSSNTFKQLFPTKITMSHEYRNYWSPTYICYKILLDYTTRLHRGFCGWRRHLRWPLASFTTNTTTLYRTTLTRLKTATAKDLELNATFTPMLLNLHQFLTTCPKALLPTHCHRYHHQIIKRIHSHQRRQYFEALSDITNKRSQLAKEKKYKILLRQFFNKHSQSYDMSSIKTPEGTLKFTPQDVHHTITDYFDQKWFNTPPQHTGHIHTSDWKRILTDFDYFTNTVQDYNIPIPILYAIWKSMNYTSNKQHQDSTLLQVLQHDINKALTNPPSIEDIRYAISQASLNTSGGQTGCTYNMMKCWSDAQLSNLHAAYALIWNSDTYPDFWNDRWMHPIPKVLAPIIELKDLRPIMLLEVTRKLFTQILIKRVTSIWEKHSALAPQQHGSRRNVMTASPIFQLLNVLEQAQESACSVFGSSYDIVHAYDSISHNIQRLGWYRLGIPEHFANLLVHMEANCRTYVKSPFAQHTLSEEGPSGFDNTPVQGFFRASRGTGQGDVPSSHCFISVFDILYRAISIYEQTFYFVQFHGHLHPAYDTGYVDDLVCIGDTLDSLQRKADIMSAFCIVFGLDIAVKKLRTFFLQWGSEAPSLPSCQIHLHHTDWDTVVPVDLSPTGTFKYLGSYIDSNGSSDTNFDIVHNRASSALSIISPKLGPNNEKIKCTLMSLYPQALYILGFCNDNLQRYNKIDTIFRKFFRHQTKHLPSFPTILIHLPHKYGGLNIPSLADRTHICKWNHVQRGQRSGSAWKIATSGLLDRYLRLSNYPRLYPFKATISATTDLPHLWSNSLIQWLHSHDLTITHGGAELPPILEPLLPLAQEFQLPSHILHALGLYHIQDISVYSQGVRTWIPSLSLTLYQALPQSSTSRALKLRPSYKSANATTLHQHIPSMSSWATFNLKKYPSVSGNHLPLLGLLVLFPTCASAFVPTRYPREPPPTVSSTLLSFFNKSLTMPS